ncbi:hypothetical protein C0J45_21173 [Silurus meridionalis]|nr:hypothetical protein C0J45_21173 [Silurus meridionalis]
MARIRMKQIYRVPFERNTERVKQLRYDYVQKVMELEADAMGHELLFVDEAGFNLNKTRKRGRNITGHRAIINVPGQRGAAPNTIHKHRDEWSDWSNSHAWALPRCFNVTALSVESGGDLTVHKAQPEVTTKSEERSSVELTEGGDVLLNCTFNFTAGYDHQGFTVYWIKTIERSSSCVYSYDLDMIAVEYNHHCNVQEDLLHRLSNQTDSKTSHNIRIRNVTESDAGQYLCVLHVHTHYTAKGNWKIINNITVSVDKDKEPEILRYSSDVLNCFSTDIESLTYLCVTLPIILVVPMAVMGVYFCRKTETSPGFQAVAERRHFEDQLVCRATLS